MYLQIFDECTKTLSSAFFWRPILIEIVLINSICIGRTFQLFSKQKIALWNQSVFNINGRFLAKLCRIGSDCILSSTQWREMAFLLWYRYYLSCTFLEWGVDEWIPRLSFARKKFSTYFGKFWKDQWDRSPHFSVSSCGTATYYLKT
jgi:hypothetical protein